MKWSFLFILAFILINFSCNEELDIGNEYSHSDFRVKTIRDYNGIYEFVQKFKYREDGKLDSIVHSNPEVIVYKYKNGFIAKVEGYFSGALNYSDTLDYTNFYTPMTTTNMHQPLH